MTAAGFDQDRGQGLYGVEFAIKFDVSLTFEHEVNLGMMFVVVRTIVLVDIDQMHGCDAVAGFYEGPPSLPAGAFGGRNLG
ncbi:MAG: hypothetical protein SynsKO_16390 [Synoicihabitans sp.]